MTTVFIIIIAALLVVVGLQYAAHMTLKKKLTQMSMELARIVENESAEKLLIHTDQSVVKKLLIGINRLLDHNQRVIADYNRTKDSLKKMTSNMSHDMRTPLTVILGYVERLKHDQVMTDEQREEIIGRLHSKIENIIVLLNQFFELVKLESEDYTMPLSRLCMNEVCRKSVLEHYELLQSKQLKVEIDIPEENLYMLGNETAVQRILSNLISNAIRYGSDGGVFGLTLREAGDQVEIEVWDRGKGIDEIHQSRVFDRLYTLDDARNPNFQGSGIGLSITKQLTEAMKGTIRLSSKPYEKTAFTCTFQRMMY
ncbi:sensor histidine kinase [Paenibacillus camelliae]|uniref:sensor histidine kinase n=1 Tax=Paenibacillus camelliae TaxID=512410 RepID=UPI002041A554|nr:sensor histidine kinase [Paenibacillus camelliae]MCM3634324.1 sensor histidine kinase [Paenibacillus camelliae]